jgi:hypothetical protein
MEPGEAIGLHASGTRRASGVTLASARFTP